MCMWILIVDDYDLVWDMISEYFVKEGVIEVKSVSLLDEVLMICEEDKVFDFLVLDYNMLGMEGFLGLFKVIENN